MIFEISTFIAVFPWMVYSMYYMDTNIRYGRYVIKNIYLYGIFVVLHGIMCMTQCSCAISFVTASIYDLLHYPGIHERVSVFILNWFLVYNAIMCIRKLSICSRFLSFLYVSEISLVQDEECQDCTDFYLLDLLYSLWLIVLCTWMRGWVTLHGRMFPLDEWRQLLFVQRSIKYCKYRLLLNAK